MTLSVAVAHRFAQFSLDAAFSAPTPGVTALFGPSGAGKSSLLAAIAGLSRPDRCQVDLDGLRLSDLPAPKRRIGLVFQDARLFPHLSVAGNLRYGQRRAPPGAIDFDAVVALLGIAHLLPRRPSSLSGGEAQRVAIGRALLAQPRLLLMDEPLSALDAARRDELLPYLAGLRALRLPILYVSHALEEVLRLAETLVLIAEGRILAAGPPEALCARPDLPLARGEDAAGILAGTLRGHWRDRGISEIACGRERLLVPFLALPLGTAVRLRVPAREIILALAPPDAISVNNVLAATIRSITPAAGGAAVTVELATGAGALLARVTAFAAQRLALQPGGAVYALVKSMSVTAVSQA